MNQNESISAIQYMGMLMSRSQLELSIVLQLVELLNRSYSSCQNVVTILQDVFENEKSGRILVGVEVLEYLVKNCNKNFHQAANRESFQKKVLGLLKRVRGKSSFLKDLRSNSQNWNKIEAKILYLVQLWYDAFILEESVFNNMINSYKILRKQNIMFPPRSVNQKNLLFVQTESPILQNIEDISRQDHKKFAKNLKNMGLQSLSHKMEIVTAEEQKRIKQRKIDIDEISERIAIVRSNGYEGIQMLKLIEEIKKDLQYGTVSSGQEKYWKDIKNAAQSVIDEWEQKNAELIKQQQKKYLEKKLSGLSIKEEKPISDNEEQDFGQFQKSEDFKIKELKQQDRAIKQADLLDLL